MPYIAAIVPVNMSPIPAFAIPRFPVVFMYMSLSGLPISVSPGIGSNHLYIYIKTKIPKLKHVDEAFTEGGACF
jgi:hypothetical protein